MWWETIILTQITDLHNLEEESIPKLINSKQGILYCYNKILFLYTYVVSSFGEYLT